MSARKSKVVKVNISAGTYKDEAEAVKEANAIKRWLIRYCDKNGYSIKGKVWISTNSAYAGRIINKGRKKEYKPNGKPLPTVVEAHIHMVLFCNPASTIVDALKSYLNKKHMKAVVWDRHCNSRAEVENAVEYAMRQSRKVRTIDYDRKDVLSVDEWGYYEAVERAEAKIKDNMAFTKSEPEQTPETLENKSVSSISDTPETLTYKSIKYNYLYYYIVPTSYSRSIIKALLQDIIYYGRESSRSSCSKIIFKIVLLKVPHLLKNVKLCAIIIVYSERDANMDDEKKIKIVNEIINDAFWLSYILELKRKLTDYNTKEVLTHFLLFYGPIFCGETLSAKFGGMAKSATTTEKEIEEFRNNNLKHCYTMTSNTAKRVIEQMGIDLDNYVFDIVLTLNDSTLLDTNFRSWNYNKAEKEKLLECVVSTPNAWVEELMPDIYETALDLLKEHTENLVNKLSCNQITQKSYSSQKLYINSILTSNDKIYILQRYGHVKLLSFFDSLFEKGISLKYKGLVIDSKTFLTKCKAILIEMLYNDSKSNNIAVLDEIFLLNKNTIPPEFYPKNRSIRDNLHYGDYHYLSDEEWKLVQEYQDVYLKNVLDVFDKNISYNFGFAYKIGLWLAKVYKWSNE